jgi:hypothetical protein
MKRPNFFLLSDRAGTFDENNDDPEVVLKFNKKQNKKQKETEGGERKKTKGGKKRKETEGGETNKTKKTKLVQKTNAKLRKEKQISPKKEFKIEVTLV